MWSLEASNMPLEAYYDRNPELANLVKKVEGAFVKTKRRMIEIETETDIF